MSPKVVDPIRRREELAEATARIDEAEALGPKVEDLRRDISRLEERRDQLAALGDDRVEIGQRSYDQRFHIEIEWEPVRSKLTGKELAATIESEIVALRQELANTESRIAALLA
jgi:hypothetical protein